MSDLALRFRTAAMGLAVVAMAIASAPAQGAVLYSQGFESNTDGWFDGSNGWFGSITRVASGTGPSLAASASGSFHAVLEQGATGLAAPQDFTGPFTDFGGFSSVWPGGFTASVDIFLDTSWLAGEGFDYSVAASRKNGLHLRDFIFHVTQDTSTGDLLVGASNNTNFEPREDLDSLVNHAVIGSSDWYTFEHVFYNDGGVLAVDMNLYNSLGSLLFSETRSDPADLIGSVVGGNRYGWQTNIDIADGIEIDNASLSVVPEPTTIALWSLGTILLGGIGWRRRRRQVA